MKMGKFFLISGGGGGVGTALCRSLAGAGYTPIIGYHSDSRIAETLADETGGRPLALDLSDNASIDAAIEDMGKAPLAGVVLAASPPPVVGNFGRINEQDMALQWQVNVAGPQRLCAGLVKKYFRKQKAGIIVAVLSAAMGTAAKGAASNMGAYVIAKYGLQGLLAVLKGEFPWLETGSVFPSYIETPMLEAFDERFLELMRQQQDFASAEEVAREILALIQGKDI